MVAVQAVQFFLLPEDRHPRLIIRCRDIRDQPPLEPGAEPRFKRLDIFRRLITGDDDLLAGYMKMVKCMEEFFLRTLLSDDELDIIDEEYVVVPVFLTEFCYGKFIAGLSCFQCINQLIGKCLAGHIENFFGRIVLQDHMSDGMHQMCLAQSDASVYEKRIVHFTRRFSNGQRCGVGEIVIASHDKGVKCIFRIQVRFFKERIDLVFLLNIFLLLFNDRFIVCYKSNLIFRPGYFRNAHFKWKQIFFFNMFKACPQFNKDVDGIIRHFINGKGGNPGVVCNIG